MKFFVLICALPNLFIIYLIVKHFIWKRRLRQAIENKDLKEAIKVFKEGL
jgi:high-affinity nickel permease